MSECDRLAQAKVTLLCSDAFPIAKRSTKYDCDRPRRYSCAVDLQAEDPEERYMLSGVSWQQYEELLEKLGDSPWYRVTYWEGVLEIMAPSRKHDRSKTDIGMLLEAYFQEARIRFWGLGSTTFRQQKQQSGTEPDECYCLGSEKEFPDLAVEVVVTSGSIDKLEVYRRLNVLEVWFWKQGSL